MITALDKHTALVLIDLQKGVVKMETAHPVKEVLANATQLIDAFRRRQLSIVVVNVNPMGAAWTRARVEAPAVPRNSVVQTLAKAALSLSGFADIVPEIKVQPGDILITKKTWNAFYGTPLHEELQKRGITGIVLAGISTSIGVEGTARAASELGYNISFATDAMTDKTPEAHNNSLRHIFPRIGETGSAQEIIIRLGPTTN